MASEQGTRSLSIIAFYIRLLLLNPYHNALLILIGYIVRISSVTIFALTVKVFLVVIEPEQTSNFLSTSFQSIGLSAPSLNRFVFFIIACLFVLVIFQYIANICYTSLFTRYRFNLVNRLANLKLAKNETFYIHVCFDRIPIGYESTIKSLEILLFYFTLLIGITVISPVIALTVLLVVVLTTYTMITSVHSDAEARAVAYKQRQSMTSLKDDIASGLGMANFNFITSKKSTTYSELYGGIGMIGIMLLYLYWQDSIQLSGHSLATLFLILSIRFVINFTGEFSRLLRSIIEQQSMLEHIDISLLDDC